MLPFIGSKKLGNNEIVDTERKGQDSAYTVAQEKTCSVCVDW